MVYESPVLRFMACAIEALMSEELGDEAWELRVVPSRRFCEKKSQLYVESTPLRSIPWKASSVWIMPGCVAMCCMSVMLGVVFSRLSSCGVRVTGSVWREL